MFVRHGACPPVTLANGHAEQTLAQSRPNQDRSSETFARLGDQLSGGLDVPERARCARSMHSAKILLPSPESNA